MTVTAGLAARLAAAVNDDGGWGYYAGQASRLEPTAWALLALSAATGSPDVVSAGQAYLAGRQQPSGELREAAHAVVNSGWNGLSLVALGQTGAGLGIVSGLAGAIVRQRGVPLANDPRSLNEQDNQLQAWSWVADTFSWVEPTAFCLLALKQARPAPAGAGDRIREAEALLFDRMCPQGGWNYGNATVLGQDLRPYVPTTALALLALQDRRTHAAVEHSLSWLETHAASEVSAMALALAATCLAVYRRPMAGLVTLLEAQDGRTGFLDNRHLMAMALYASTIPAHDARAFRVAGNRR